MTAADRLTKIRALVADPSYGSVPRADVVWLCDRLDAAWAEEVRLAEHVSRQRMALSAAEDALADLRAGVAGWVEQARVLRKAAEAVRTFAADTYPEDIFRAPSVEDYREINALLSRERGHMLDGVAADCYRRALAIGARELDVLADEAEEADRDR